MDDYDDIYMRKKKEIKMNGGGKSGDDRKWVGWKG